VADEFLLGDECCGAVLAERQVARDVLLRRAMGGRLDRDHARWQASAVAVRKPCPGIRSSFALEYGSARSGWRRAAGHSPRSIPSGITTRLPLRAGPRSVVTG